MFENDPKFRGPSPSDIGYEPEVASGPVYQNSDVRSEPSPEHDEIVYCSEEEVSQYPEGAYQTWSSRQQEDFEVDGAADTVRHFFG